MVRIPYSNTFLKELGAFIEPYRSYDHRTTVTEIMGAFFEETIQHLMLDRPYGTTVCIENEVAVSWVSSSHFQARKTRKR
jgi:hypothetical protein